MMACEHGRKEQEPLERRRKMVRDLAFSDRFERFLAKRFNTAKRFGVEGTYQQFTKYEFIDSHGSCH